MIQIIHNTQMPYIYIFLFCKCLILSAYMPCQKEVETHILYHFRIDLRSVYCLALCGLVTIMTLDFDPLPNVCNYHSARVWPKLEKGFDLVLSHQPAFIQGKLCKNYCQTFPKLYASLIQKKLLIQTCTNTHSIFMGHTR